MNNKYLFGSLLAFLMLINTPLAAAGPSTVEEELVKQKKYADQLMVSINSGKYSEKQLEALKILHQKILDFPIPTQEELNKRYEEDQKKLLNAEIVRENRRMADLPINADRMETNSDILDRDYRRGTGDQTPE
ncbi:MAG: hypothetical protein ACJ0FI_06105 [Gammaproteobacteria bacterium]